jgi:hypothetical protein
MAVLGGLAWPWGAPGPGPTAVSAADPICLPTIIVCPTATPTTTPTQTPRPTATPSGGHPAPGPGNPPGANPGSVTNPGEAVGAVPGPGAPPSVSATSIEVVADRLDPQPGTVATLTITVSGNEAADRYGVAGAAVDLLMTEQPGTDAQLGATSLVTDAAGAAYVKLTLSKTRGRHVVNVTSATLSAQYVADTLGAGGQLSRTRHNGEIVAVPPSQRGSPLPFFVAAVISLVLGFAAPYIKRLVIALRSPPPIGPPSTPSSGSRPQGRLGLGVSSKRTN